MLKSCLKCQQDKPSEAFLKANGKVMLWCADCRTENGKRSKAGNAPEVYGNDYASRQRNLKAMGFSTYAEYLASDLWKQVRARVFAAKGRRCVACSNPAEQVHHNRYHANDLSGKQIRYLVPVCRSCHEAAEFEGGKKVTLRKAKKAINRMRKAAPLKPLPARVVDFSSL
jgi:cytochrome c553